MTASVIFLDVDGVLAIRPQIAAIRAPRPAMVSGGRLVSPTASHPPLRRVAPQRSISRQAVARLGALCAASNAQVVVSSSWRFTHPVREILVRHGFGGAFHTDWRTDDVGRDRGGQIDRWLQAHGDPGYVILDDFPQFTSAQQPKLVLVDYRVGLQDRDCARALALLRQAGVSAE